ncbi:MAG: hypothetical protein ACF8SC_03565 [Phycisphaerales bacterium JB037]
MTRKAMLAVVSAGVLVGLGGCKMSSKDDSAEADSATQVAAATPVNTICPIGGHEVPDNTRTVAYKGHTIVFCCDGCVEAWGDEDEAGRDAILAIALAEKQGK